MDGFDGPGWEVLSSNPNPLDNIKDAAPEPTASSASSIATEASLPGNARADSVGDSPDADEPSMLIIPDLTTISAVEPVSAETPEAAEQRRLAEAGIFSHRLPSGAEPVEHPPTPPSTAAAEDQKASTVPADNPLSRKLIGNGNDWSVRFAAGEGWVAGDPLQPGEQIPTDGCLDGGDAAPLAAWHEEPEKAHWDEEAPPSQIRRDAMGAQPVDRVPEEFRSQPNRPKRRLPRIGLPDVAARVQEHLESGARRLKKGDNPRSSKPSTQEAPPASNPQAGNQSVPAFRMTPGAKLPDCGRLYLATSSRGGEGKTTLAAYLAMTLSRRMPVLLVDGDVKRPELAEFLGMEGSIGDGWEHAWLHGSPERGVEGWEQGKLHVWPLFSRLEEKGTPKQWARVLPRWEAFIAHGGSVVVDVSSGEPELLKALRGTSLSNDTRLVYLYQPIPGSGVAGPYWLKGWTVQPVAFLGNGDETMIPLLPDTLVFPDRRAEVWRERGSRVPAPLAPFVEAIAAQASGLIIDTREPSRDTLTGLPLRDALPEVALEPHAVLFVDLNGLKGINDSEGHAAGDRYIQKAARVLQGAVKQNDLLVRMNAGGDEFGVYMPGVRPGEEQAILERIRQAMTRSGVSGALGIAAGNTGSRVEDVLHEADREMYRDKQETDHGRRAGIAGAV